MNPDITKVVPEILPSAHFRDWRKLPTLPGIYFVSNSSSEIVYIGATRNLCQRWKGHERLKNCAATEDYRVSWLIVTNVEGLNDIEDACILQFHPLWNKRLSKSDGIGIIGQRLRQARYDAKMSQERLAKLVNVRVTYISRIETGKVLNLSNDFVIAVSNVLQISSECLLAIESA